MSAIALLGSPVARAGATSLDTAPSSRIPVILDTDLYSSADDVGAETTLLAYDLMGVDNVIAIGINTRLSRPDVATDSWKCAAAIAQFYGFPNVPIGADMPDDGPDPATNNFIGPCAADASPYTAQPESAVELYRKALVAEPDDSVVIVCTGYEENIDNLLNSPPDSISSLTGSQLVAEKVKMLVMMGGGYPSRDGENNFEGNPGAAEDVAANWPTKVVYSGYEVGSQVLTGGDVTSVQPSDSPVAAAMLAFAGADHAITSFDMTAAYHAIEPGDAALTEVGPGQNSIDEYGDNTFTTGTGDEYYLDLNDVSGLETTLDDAWDTLPGTTSQGLQFTSSAPSNPLVDGTYQPTTNTGETGNPVTLTIDGSSTSGCTIDGAGLVTLSAPAGTCVIDADEPGSTTYAPAEVQQSLQVSLIPQDVAFTSTPPSAPTVGGSYQPTASGGSSGNPVTFSIDPSSTSGCSYAAGKVTFSGPAGSCVIDASQQGNASYAAGAAQQTVDVAKIAQAIAFTSTAPTSPTVGSTYDVAATGGASSNPVTFSIDAASTSGCTVADATVTFSEPAGTCIVDANQLGDASYAAAMQVQQTIDVSGDAQTISFTSTPPGHARVGGASYVPSATSSSGLDVTLSLDPSSSGCTLVSGTLDFTSVGTCILDANQAGNATYLPATQMQQRIAVGKGSAVITVTARPPAHPQAGGTYSPAATSSSGDMVHVSLGSASTGCAIAKGVVQFRGVGTCLVVFSDPGSKNFDAAIAVRERIVIARGHVRVTAGASPASAPSGSRIALSATVTSAYATGTVTFTIGSTTLCVASVHQGTARCSAVAHEGRGSYSVAATYSGSTSYFKARGTTSIKLS